MAENQNMLTPSEQQKLNNLQTRANHGEHLSEDDSHELATLKQKQQVSPSTTHPKFAGSPDKASENQNLTPDPKVTQKVAGGQATPRKDDVQKRHY